MTPEFVKNRLPIDVTENNERFVKFIEDYYKHGMTEGFNAMLENFKSLLYQQSYSKEFEERMIKSFGIDISLIETSKVNGELLYKLLNEFLETRGTKTSFEILFRMMFNKQVDIVYPRDSLFRPSDAVYLRTDRILISGTYPLSIDSTITGLLSKKTTGIESFLPYYVDGVRYYLVDCSNIYDKFSIGEPLTISNLDYEYNEVHVPLIDLEIVNGGRYYKKNDIIRPNSNIFDGEFVVSSIEKGSIDNIIILNGGTNYKIGEVITFNFSSHFRAIISEVDVNGTVTKIKIKNKGYNLEEIHDYVVHSEDGDGLLLKLESNTIGRVKQISLTQGSVILSMGNISYIIESELGEGLIVKNKAVDSYLHAEYKNKRGILSYNSTLVDSNNKHSHSYNIISEVPAVKYNKIVAAYANPSGYVFNKIYTKTNKIKINNIEVNGELIRE